MLAFSASNIHYSRLALNNITTPFFWAVCFLFLLRGLRSRQPLDWSLAGLSAGLSEYFYYGTRLLPFILILFLGYILAFYWKQARHYLTGFSCYWQLAISWDSVLSCSTFYATVISISVEGRA